MNIFLFIKNMFIFSRLFNKNNSKQKTYGIENNSSISYIVRRIILNFFIQKCAKKRIFN